MMKLLPILLIGLFAVLSVHFSAWRMERSLRAQSRPLKHDQVDRMLDRLAAAAGIDRIELHLLRNDTVNGLATPQGGIYLTSGLFRHYQSGRLSLEEIGSVVAHELGHLALGHTKRRMIEVSAAQTGTLVLGSLLARFIPFVGWYLAQALVSLFVSGLSRRD
ncbi:MAG: M48 family metalloprotease, partial [Pseudomonadota bacterium]